MNASFQRPRDSHAGSSYATACVARACMQARRDRMHGHRGNRGCTPEGVVPS